MTLHIEDQLAELEAKATPGPWSVRVFGAGDFDVTASDAPLGHDVVTGSASMARKGREEESYANAHVIAALRNVSQYQIEVLRAARRLLEGVQHIPSDGTAYRVDGYKFDEFAQAIAALDAAGR